MSKSSLENNRVKRAAAVRLLIDGQDSIDKLRIALEPFEFDSEPLAVLRAEDIIEKISRFLDNQIDQLYLEQWADLIEVREDIEFERVKEKEIKQVIHDLANPVLAGALDETRARQMTLLLSK
jgi:hypothetical protein